ncbi:YheE family protein [Paenisporosarcina cavernae]|uniref:YheE family protein n=1 Tax=Paenisporosarcina cavernae TaxID=2320858 RepID=A0A385YWA9_9BACL|nr:YheE family protein [Paenisporosarcina cavernae]AYC30187.1 hypothetical protein D3873_10010 [Paenisporosarcina cavernae]
MLQHFQFKPMYENKSLPGWIISFYYQSKKFTADYQKDGAISWHGEAPDNLETVEKMVHELMLFHVYD